MIYFKRFLWLAAWSVWVWLGFGLYRELPRDLGPVVCRLPLTRHESPLGFLKESTQVVVQTTEEPGVCRLRLYDAATGRLVREYPPHVGQTFTWMMDCRNHGVVFVRGEQRHSPGLHVLDLDSGLWKTIADHEPHSLAIHPTKPWVAFTKPTGRMDPKRRVIVVNWTTNEEVFALPEESEQLRVESVLFLGATDQLLVPTSRTPKEWTYDNPTDFEIWSIGPPSRLAGVAHSPYFGFQPTVQSDRIAFTVAGPETNYMDVFDFDESRMALSVPPPEKRVLEGDRTLIHPATLSKSGKTVLGGYPPQLWDIDARRPIWTAERKQSAVADHAKNTFKVLEEWVETKVGQRVSPWNTYAVHDMESGRVVERYWLRDELICSSADGRLGLGYRGVVNELPRRVNWQLLVFCQTILALPLLMTWAILRWRRRRRATRPVLAQG